MPLENEDFPGHYYDHTGIHSYTEVPHVGIPSIWVDSSSIEDSAFRHEVSNDAMDNTSHKPVEISREIEN